MTSDSDDDYPVIPLSEARRLVANPAAKFVDVMMASHSICESPEATLHDLLACVAQPHRSAAWRAVHLLHQRTGLPKRFDGRGMILIDAAFWRDHLEKEKEKEKKNGSEQREDSLPVTVEFSFSELDPATEADAAAAFLSAHPWPFHARRTLTLDEARQIELGPPDRVRAFWIYEAQGVAGLIRVFDLEHAEHGSVLFDLRLAESFRGRQLGRAVVAWIVDRLFTDYPLLHRIEAATRIDNLAMRRVLEINRFVLEGQLRETWRSQDGTRHDTALYGRLRTDA
jgi:RimJ/RimL family protein N-acetyltransferase